VEFKDVGVFFIKKNKNFNDTYSWTRT
jgi:hypothetical protein